MQLSEYPVETVIALAHRERSALRELAGPLKVKPMRWHDPCQLGRGLGLFDEPRSVLRALLGRAPEEFRARGEEARCSGGGALLPVSHPDVSRRIAEQRVNEHESAGGGTIVTGCASSMRRFRRSGAAVVDIADLLAEGVIRP
jgi:Fe-S oxidoreductase